MASMHPSGKIFFWDRREARIREEQVFGEAYLRWLYETPVGRALGEGICRNPFFSRLFGAFQNTSFSADKIPAFIRKFEIPIQEYETVSRYRSFNEFFIRKFKPGARTFTEENNRLAAFAEGRYLGYGSLEKEAPVPIKGTLISPGLLLGSESAAVPFDGGPILISRLCPTDYHRFHFPDDGTVEEEFHLKGPFHSVNPVALGLKDDILVTNDRHVTLLSTKHFGHLAYVEVGALCVGRIVQTCSGREFKRGDEKGYFLFGGSTVVVLGQKGRWIPSSDILEQTRLGRETLVRLGEPVGLAI